MLILSHYHLVVLCLYCACAKVGTKQTRGSDYKDSTNVNMRFREYGGSAQGPAKSWVFTLNNYTEDHVQKLEELGADADVVSYLVFGREVGESGTPHLQGCVTFKKARRRNAVARDIPNAWLAVAKHLARARKYCLKEDENAFVADHRKQGSRTDLEEVVETLRGGTIVSVLEQHPETYVKFHGGLDKLASAWQTPRDPSKPPQVWWIYGSTGVGKSRYVHEMEQDLWVSMGTHKWWEGYNQQSAMLIDDMRCNYAPFNELLKIIDRYPYRAERKGSSIQVNSDRIYITSQYPPHKVYNRENRNSEDIRQLYRRLTRVIHAQSSYTALPESSFSFIRHGVLFESKSIEDLLQDDQETACASFFNPP